MQQARKTGKYDYDAPIAGLEVLDRYTLRIRLKQPDYNFLYVMAMPMAVGMAREVVEYYGDDVRAHPVGTGALHAQGVAALERDCARSEPEFPRRVLHRIEGKDAGGPRDIPKPAGQTLARRGAHRGLDHRGAAAALASVSTTRNSTTSRICQTSSSISSHPTASSPRPLRGAAWACSASRSWRLRLPRFTTCVIRSSADIAPDKVALRRAINLGYNQPEEILIARKGQAVPAESPIPPGAAGYDPNFHSIASEYDPTRAKAILDTFGYRDRDGDGYREMPDGRPLVLEFASPPDTASRDLDQIWKKSMDAIGIHIKFKKERWPDLVKESRAGTLQVGSFLAWYADYPDGDNFLQLLYGPNASPQSNSANFALPAFDRLYEQAREMPDSPQRDPVVEIK